jgi:3-phenylpropionate/trans-cinnamate dioxygenase ferredoxin reductase component
MKNVVIAGAGHAAGQVVASLLQKKFDGHIALFGEEPWYPYQRPPLSKKFLAGEMPAERLYYKPPGFYSVPNVDVQLDTRITAIDRTTQTVSTAAGRTIDYDYLVIATGSRPRELPLPGIDRNGIHYLRGIDDVNGIRADMDRGSRMVIVGAGYIGLEVAAVAAQLGQDVTVVEMEDRVMSRVVSPELSRFYQDVHSANGVKLRLSTRIKGFEGSEDNGRLNGVVLDDDSKIPADTVVIGIGIVPNIELAADAGLDVGNGIVVDDHCRTSDPHIYAVGDCTWHPNDILGIELRLESVHNALEQAKTAADNICGGDASYAQVPWFWSDQYDLKLQIVGLSQGYDEVVIRGDPASRSFACLYLHEGTLIAVDAVNSPKDFVQSKSLIAAHAKIDPTLLADTGIALKDMPQ